MIYNQKLLWIDLEMTGLDPLKEQILELAAVVIDWQLEPLAQIELVWRHDTRWLEDRFSQSEFWQNHPLIAEQLFAQNQSGLLEADFKNQLLEFMKTNFSKPNGDIILAGNTIRADRAFIEQHLPELNPYLHYRMLDVSAFKVYFEGRYQQNLAKPQVHRAVDDINNSINELKHWSKFINLENQTK